jgi:hypothetical protein
MLLYTSRPAYFLHHQLLGNSTYNSVTIIFHFFVEEKVHYCVIYIIKNFARAVDIFFLTLMQKIDVAIIYDYGMIHYRSKIKAVVLSRLYIIISFITL